MIIKKISESLDDGWPEEGKFDKYFTISEEEIRDLSLEMIDNGFNIVINRKFYNSDNSTTEEPITQISYPIYEIYYNNKREEIKFEYNSDEYYDIKILYSFVSSANKMKKLLHVKDVSYSIAYGSHRLQITLNSISLVKDQIGFSFNKFSDKFYSFVSSMENGIGIDIKDFHHGSNAGYCEIFYEGKYIDNDEISDEWQKTDEFDNIKEYSKIIKRIESFLEEYNSFLKINIDYEYIRTTQRSKKSLFTNPKVKKYNIYTLVIRFQKK